ncbi:MAG: hypothetical protein J6J99_05435 [Oscillibacter sp.]|nr:hypothetical protein [Oscillibacter sp.]
MTQLGKTAVIQKFYDESFDHTDAWQPFFHLNEVAQFPVALLDRHVFVLFCDRSYKMAACM